MHELLELTEIYDAVLVNFRGLDETRKIFEHLHAKPSAIDLPIPELAPKIRAVRSHKLISNLVKEGFPIKVTH